jgi:hypothetical protein
MSSDLPGVNPATLNGMLLYYRLMTKWSGLGDSTELSRVGLSQVRTYIALFGQTTQLLSTVHHTVLYYSKPNPSSLTPTHSPNIPDFSGMLRNVVVCKNVNPKIFVLDVFSQNCNDLFLCFLT